jgi:hypothetical protein
MDLKKLLIKYAEFGYLLILINREIIKSINNNIQNPIESTYVLDNIKKLIEGSKQVAQLEEQILKITETLGDGNIKASLIEKHFSNTVEN